MREGRWITQRTSYLERQAGLRRSVAEALARSERGYSQSAIARAMDTVEGTVGSWHDQVAVEYGLPALYPLYQDQYKDPPDLYPATSESLADQPRERQAEWANRAARNLEHVPAENPARFLRSFVLTHDLVGLVNFDPEDLAPATA